MDRSEETPTHGAGVGDAGVVHVNEVIGAGSIRPYSLMILALFVLIGMTEGYDVAVMSLAAPMLAKLWALGPAQIGQLLSASVVGLVLGSFLLSPLGDRRGRRLAILIGLAIGGAGTAAGAIARDFGEMVVIRLIAGAGLGMALPNTITLVMELMPWRFRSLAIVIVSSGLALGGGIGAIIVGGFIQEYGYPVIFVFGGIVTLAALLLSLMFLPESPFLLVRQGATGAVERLVHRLTGVDVTGRTLDYRTEAKPNSTIAALFTPERRAATLLLWLINFAGIGLVYFFINWTPSLLVAVGFSPETGIRAAALFAVSGVAGSLVQVWLLPRVGPIVLLGSAYTLAIIASALLVALVGRDGLFFAVLILAAAASVGAQFCLNAIVAHFYPATIRATGAAYATGAGRIGAIIAPLAAGIALQAVGSPRMAFGFAILPALIGLLAVIVLGRNGSLRRIDEPVD